MRGTVVPLLLTLMTTLALSGCLGDAPLEEPPGAAGSDPDQAASVCSSAQVFDDTYTSMSNEVVHQKTSTTLPEGAVEAWLTITPSTVAGSYDVWVTDPDGARVAQSDYLGVHGPGVQVVVLSSVGPGWEDNVTAGEHHVHVETQGVVMDLEVTLEVTTCV